MSVLPRPKLLYLTAQDVSGIVLILCVQSTLLPKPWHESREDSKISVKILSIFCASPFTYPDAGDAKTAGLPGRIEEQPGDGRRANLWLRESAGPPAVQQCPHTAARLHR